MASSILYYPQTKECIVDQLPAVVSSDGNGNLVCDGGLLSARLRLCDCILISQLPARSGHVSEAHRTGTRIDIAAYGSCSLQATINLLAAYLGEPLDA